MQPEPRLIPTLLLSKNSFVKTTNFQSEVYVGDPLNVISIFNQFEVDEIVLIDIDNSRNGKVSNLDSLKALASKIQLPLTYGGGLSSLEEVDQIIRAGFEKVLICSAILHDEKFVKSVVDKYGSQAVVGGLDYRLEENSVVPYANCGQEKSELSLKQWCSKIIDLGVGEMLLTNINREGTLVGLDHETISQVSNMVTIPVIANGGANSRSDLARAINENHAAAAAAGTIFLMQKKQGSVLINYPSRKEIKKLFPKYYKDSEVRDFVDDDHADELTFKSLNLHKMCSRCLITDDIPNSMLAESDICYYCGVHDALDRKYPVGVSSEKALAAFVEKLKKDGKGKKYDCIMGVSGGTDSSFLAHLLVKHGVRPLAVHFDNTWNSPIATSNIYKVLDALGIDLETYVVDNQEYDDLYRSFILAGVRDIEAPTDIGFMGVLYRYAEKHQLKHIVEGHSFRTEGVSPIGWLYMDGGYIKNVQKKYGTFKLRTYPNMTFFNFLKWSAFSSIERTRPLYWIDYNKEDAKEFLKNTYGWEWYGGHHLENRFTAFYHTYFLPNRFGLDFRQIEFSALVRSGQRNRDDAIKEFAANRVADAGLVDFTIKRLGYSKLEFEKLMRAPKRTYRDFKTYKQRFEILKPLFWVLMKFNRVPESFYVKFCKKS
jgi:imidazoleglycerol phosphate synthase cyclase subunit